MMAALGVTLERHGGFPVMSGTTLRRLHLRRQLRLRVHATPSHGGFLTMKGSTLRRPRWAANRSHRSMQHRLMSTTPPGAE
jgi:hypothetical protein